MNHIQRLQMEKAQAEAKALAFEMGLNDLKAYLHSPKFHSDTTVQVQDIFSRLAEVRTAALDAGDAAAIPFLTCQCGHFVNRHETYREYGRVHTYCEGDRSKGRHVRNCDCTGFVPASQVAEVVNESVPA